MKYLGLDITNEQSFAPIADEKSIRIVPTKKGFQFTRHWFTSRNQSTWSTFLPQKFSNTQPVNMIQIGVFEGMDLVWCLQNILAHSSSRVVAIDPWLATEKLDAQFMKECQDRAIYNLQPWEGKVLIVPHTSSEELPKLHGARTIRGKRIKEGEWDLIVIDGDHNAPVVYEDAKHAIDLVCIGGWIVFDDVRNKTPKVNHVKQGLEQFLGEFGQRVKLVWAHRFSNCYERIS